MARFLSPSTWGGYTIGCTLVVIVAFIWVFASFVVSSLEDQHVGTFLIVSILRTHRARQAKPCSPAYTVRDTPGAVLPGVHCQDLLASFSNRYQKSLPFAFPTSFPFPPPRPFFATLCL